MFKLENFQTVFLAIIKLLPPKSEKANRGSCAVKLDFSEAIDRIDRSLHQNFERFNHDEFSVRAIETLYSDSKAVIEIHGFLSASFKIHRGVRRGCSFSAFFFIVFIEALLQAIVFTEAIEVFGLLCPNLISFVDNLSCFIKIQFIDMLCR